MIGERKEERRERERERERERREEKREVKRKRNISLLFHLVCIDWLIRVCALTGDLPPTLACQGQHSNQLSYLARAGRIDLLNM